MENRHLIIGICLAFLAYLLYAQVYYYFNPPKPKPLSTASAPADLGRARPGQNTGAAPGSGPAVLSSGPAATQAFVLKAGASVEPITLGGGEAKLEIVVSPRGAAVERITLNERDPRTGRFRYRQNAKQPDPYQIVTPIDTPTGRLASFATPQVWVPEFGEGGFALDQLVWTVVESSSTRVVFETELTGGEPPRALLRIRKTFTHDGAQPLINLTLEFFNLSGQPLTVIAAQDGPIGIPGDDPQRDYRRVLATKVSEGAIYAGTAKYREQLCKAAGNGPVPLITTEVGEKIAWVALGSKYFGIFTRPLTTLPDGSNGIDSVAGLCGDPTSSTSRGDLVTRLLSTRLAPAPDGSKPAKLDFEIYAGPKDRDILVQVNPAYADSRQLAYNLLHASDVYCFCAPLWLTELMTWLYQSIRWVVGNGGLAIIGIVIIVRTLLHPLTVFQQKSMYRMQEVMVRLQPRIQAIKDKYPNDQVKQNQEMMKLYADEGFNPLAPMVGMLPLFLQMPILAALWTALNTDIHLRHASFDGWWLKDLSAPDALIEFDPPISIPVLSWLPLIGYAFSNIPAFNLMPVLMGVSMWLQNKYMPKPHLQARREAAQSQPHTGGMSPEEQIRQQEMMARMMAILFPIMFYYMPSGLNLYWMATTVFGIGESLIIRRQLAAEKLRREQQGPQPPKPKKGPGLIARFFKKIADQAEELQRKADELSEREKKKKDEPPDRDKDRRKGGKP